MNQEKRVLAYARFLLLTVFVANAAIGSKKIKKATTVTYQTAKPCQLENAKCYCSFKCDERDIEDKDDPRFDPKTGKCFCAERDWAAYSKNECAD